LLGRLCSKLGRKDEAVEHYKNMLEMNSCNYDTYYKILAVMGFELFDRFGNVQSISQQEQKRLL